MKGEFVFKDPAEFAAPRNGVCTGYIDRWWPVDDRGFIALYQPRRGRVSYEYPQCNQDRRIAVSLGGDWAHRVIQIPAVVLPMNMSEYH